MWSQESFRKNKGLPQGSHLVSFFTSAFMKTTSLNTGCQKLSTTPRFGTQLKSSHQQMEFQKMLRTPSVQRPAWEPQRSGSGHALVPSGQNQTLSTTEDFCPAVNPTLSLGMLTWSLHWVSLLSRLLIMVIHWWYNHPAGPICALCSTSEKHKAGLCAKLWVWSKPPPALGGVVGKMSMLWGKVWQHSQGEDNFRGLRGEKRRCWCKNTFFKMRRKPLEVERNRSKLILILRLPF